MPKYRRLRPEELEALRDEFVQFLASNSIPAEDWEKLKKTSADETSKVIDIFSDIVWEKVLTKTQYVEIRKSNLLQVMKFGDEKTDLIQIAIKHPTFDFRNPEDIRGLADGRIKLASLQPEVHTGKKTHSLLRNEEIFYQLERGGVAVDASMWDLMTTFVGSSMK
jgi:hypothetical protein